MTCHEQVPSEELLESIPRMVAGIASQIGAATAPRGTLETVLTPNSKKLSYAIENKGHTSPFELKPVIPR